MTFDALDELTRGVNLDLIVTFMTGYVRRFLKGPQFDGALDRFLGTSDWRSFRTGLEHGQNSPTYRQLLDLYKDQLRKLGYLHVEDHVQIRNSRDRGVYHLVFASRHPRGADFFRKISRKQASGQLRLMEAPANYLTGGPSDTS